MLSVTDKSRIGSDDQQRYTLSLAEATEFEEESQSRGVSQPSGSQVERRYDAESL